MFISFQSVLDFDFLPSNEVLNTLSVLPFLVNWWMAPLQLLGRNTQRVSGYITSRLL